MYKMLCLLILLGMLLELPSNETAEKSVHKDDPDIVEKLKNLKPGQSIFLPNVVHMAGDEKISGDGKNGPYARDYTTKMVYAPERQTSMYAGGNHGMGRTNDVWEFHLGSNTWYRLFKADGGDHAKHKLILMFMPRKWNDNKDYKLTEKEESEFNNAKIWWKANVEIKDGVPMTKNGGTLLHGHTWDTLVYDPINKRLIQGTGAHCASDPWLLNKFDDIPYEDAKKMLGKNKDGVQYRSMWIFDLEKSKWQPYAHESQLASLRGMGASFIYLEDIEKMVYFVAAQNVQPSAFQMTEYDPKTDSWREMKPNGGKSFFDLAYKEKVMPSSEMQLAYSLKEKEIVAVRENTTYAYNVKNNEWRKLNDTIPLKAHDAHTIFAYNSEDDVFLLADCRKGQLASFDLKSNTWKAIEVDGPKMKKPPYCVGKGYYDPRFNVFVVQSAFSNMMWVYKYGK